MMNYFKSRPRDRDIVVIISYIICENTGKRVTCMNNLHHITILYTTDNARWVGGATKKFRKISVAQAVSA